MKILITGGTGFLGTELVDQLIRTGNELIISSRHPKIMLPFPARFVKWPLDASELKNHINDIDACIHLAGEPIAGKRWTAEQKKKIYESRISGTRDLVQILSTAPKLKVFISGSAIGYYGNREDEDLTENSSAGDGFLAEVCKDWEDEALSLNRKDVRTVFLRTGLVLDRGKGFLEPIEPLFQNGIAGPLGNGKQYMSWIHINDWVHACMHALNTDSVSGPLNLTAPNPATNKGFTYTLGELFKQSFYPPAPAVAIKVAMGEMAALALEGQKTLPEKLIKTGFKFKYPDLKEALENIFETGEHQQICDYFPSRQYIPADLDTVFDFFSDAKNLEQITPPLLNFKIEKMSTENIQKGTLIDYKLKIHGIPAKWRTLIEKWQPNSLFVDTQLRGPYKKWHHTHTFERFRDGTLMKDRVHYKLPVGFLGRTFGLWLVKKDVQNIFKFREQKIQELFPGQ